MRKRSAGFRVPEQVSGLLGVRDIPARTPWTSTLSRSFHEFLGLEPKLIESVGLNNSNLAAAKGSMNMRVGWLQLQSCPVWNGSQLPKEEGEFLVHPRGPILLGDNPGN
jgi:hypothetical protein